MRFGTGNSATFAAMTTLTSTGSVDSFHDSYSGLGGGILMFNMMLGEVAPGGVGSGLYGMLVLAIITVFVAGLMVGRTPEYLGKKIGAREIKLASLYFLITPFLVLVGTALAMASADQRAAMLNTGTHGFSEVLYAFTSASNNNGSAFAGLTVNTWWYDLALGLCMLLGRFLPIVLVLALAGSLARQTPAPASAGTMPTHTPLFVSMLIGSDRGAGRAHVPAGPRAGPARGRTRPMNAPATLTPGWAASTPAQLVTVPARRAGQARPADHVAQPGDAHRRGRRRVHHRARRHRPTWFAWLITGWLWATVVFANLAEAVAEGRGKAQADTLRKTRQGTVARRVTGWQPGTFIAEADVESVPAPELAKGDIVVCEAGDVIPGDGDVVEGIASVDESAITGESAPVIRESGGDRCAVTGGTKVLSDRIVVQITQTPGESFIDRMISLVEGANRQKTPNEIALNILLAALTLIFLMAVVTLQPLAIYAKSVNAAAPDTAALDGNGVTGVVLGGSPGVPDPHHDRRAAVGDRHRRHGPAGAAQRAGDERPRGRGRRRREHPAAGQDRHHHPRQPAGLGVRARSPASTLRCWPTPRSCPAWPTRPPRVARSWSTPNGRMGCGSGRPASSPTRSGCRSPPRPGCPVSTWTAGRSARVPRPRSCTGSERTAATPQRASAPPSTRSAPPAAPRWWSRRRPATSRPAPSASSTSRTWSRRACANASTRCAGWASAP